MRRSTPDFSFLALALLTLTLGGSAAAQDPAPAPTPAPAQDPASPPPAAAATPPPAAAPAPAPAPKPAEPPKKADPRITELRREGEGLLAKGDAKKARAAFEKADDLAAGACAECLAGWVEADLRLGKLEEAARMTRALTDLARTRKDPPVDRALLERVAAAYRQEVARAEKPDPDLLRGLFDLLARLGAVDEIVTLAMQHLAQAEPEAQAAICGVDSRPSLVGKLEPLDIGAKLNEQLQAAGWKGPWLAVGKLKKPVKRHQSFSEGGEDTLRVVGVVNPRGFVTAVQVVGRQAVKSGELGSLGFATSFFDPAQLGGVRVSACVPFAVQTKPGRRRGGLLAQGKPPAQPIVADEAAYAALVQAADLNAVMTLLEQFSLGDTSLGRRSAICAVYDKPFAADVNAKLVEKGWKGPFLLPKGAALPAKVSGEAPKFPDEARQNRVSGELQLLAVIDETGKTDVAAVVQGLPSGVTEAAVKTLKTWIYSPTEIDGKAVPVCFLVTATITVQ